MLARRWPALKINEEQPVEAGAIDFDCILHVLILIRGYSWQVPPSCLPIRQEQLPRTTYQSFDRPQLRKRPFVPTGGYGSRVPARWDSTLLTSEGRAFGRFIRHFIRQ